MWTLSLFAGWVVQNTTFIEIAGLIFTLHDLGNVEWFCVNVSLLSDTTANLVSRDKKKSIFFLYSAAPKIAPSYISVVAPLPASYFIVHNAMSDDYILSRTWWSVQVHRNGNFRAAREALDTQSFQAADQAFCHDVAAKACHSFIGCWLCCRTTARICWGKALARNNSVAAVAYWRIADKGLLCAFDICTPRLTCTAKLAQCSVILAL